MSHAFIQGFYMSQGWSALAFFVIIEYTVGKFVCHHGAELRKGVKMSRKETVTLTNMCLIEDKAGKVVVQIRDPKRYRWSGAAFPGGHVEEGENFHDSVVREVLEETGLTITNARLVGIKHWPDKEGHRYLVFLYKATNFSGTLRSTEEGEVRWVKKIDLPKMDLAYDLLEILKVMDDEEISEFFYTKKDSDGEWDRNFR